jgi:hypothetical protein
MNARAPVALAAMAGALALSGCMESSRLGHPSSVGPDPSLPSPTKTLVPTVHIAPAQGWPEGQAPVPAQGMRVGAFAKDLQHPRWVYVLPNGDVLVAETNAPPRPEEGKGGEGPHHDGRHETCRRGSTQREPHHAASRWEWRRCSRGARNVPREPELALRHCAHRQRSLCRQQRRDRPLPLSRRGHEDHLPRHEGDRPSGRTAQPPLDEEHHREP